MSIKIIFSNKVTNNPSSNLVLFSNDKFDTKGLKKYLSDSELHT